MLESYLQILRVFGLSGPEISVILRTVRDEGCTGLRLLERDGEFAVCVQADGPTRELARNQSEKWAQKLRERFGDALYAEGDTTLAQATLNALLEKRHLIVAADETTGRLLGGVLEALQHSEAVFDFGTQTYLHSQNSRRILVPLSIQQRFPGDPLQAAAGRALAAMVVAKADHAVTYMPAGVDQPPFVLLCDRQGAVARAVDPEAGDNAVTNHLLDLVRRRVLGLPMGSGTVSFRPGYDRAELPDPEEEARRAATRFHKVQPPVQSEATQVPLTAPITTAVPVTPVAPAAPITSAPQPEPRPAAQPAAPYESRSAQPAQSAPPYENRPAQPTPPASPYESRSVQPTPQPAQPTWSQPAAPRPMRGEIVLESDYPSPIPTPAQPVRPVSEPPHSLLDDPIPDFTVTPPPAPTPAPAPTTTQRFRFTAETAANLGYSQPQPQPAQQPAPEPTGNADDGSVVETFSSFYTQLAATQPPPPPPEPQPNPYFRTSTPPQVGGLYGQNVPQQNDADNASLQRIEREERRKRIIVIAVLAVLLVILLAGGLGLWWYFSNRAGREPAPRNYGTTRFDEQAVSYLATARRDQPSVVGYLAFPGQEGELVYGNAAQPESGAVLCDPSYLGSTAPGHTVLTMESSLTALADLETLRENSGFTIYLPNATYRFKVLAVYSADPKELGAGMFDPTSYGDLSDYGSYLRFVLGVQVRSLFDTGVQPGLNASFTTLTAKAEDGTLFCVTGRLVRRNESAQLGTTQIKEAERPLLTAAQYAATGGSMPNVNALLAAALEKYAADRSTLSELNADYEPDDGLDALQQQLDDLHASTQNMLAQTDELLMKGLTDIAGSAGASVSETGQSSSGEGTLPEAQVAIPTARPAATPGPTAAPTSVPSPTPTLEPGATPGPTQAPTPTPAPTPAPNVETLDVTMNGTAQSIELVRCLAMIAQNELGSNAPAEAYKAQCVAAHCWILSQSGYPSVLGQEPGAAALAAAQEVAHVLVTYNGAVAFTPYFASASKGTVSSADVWGGERAWLQPVASPYDEQYATNWHTNGATSGTARFSRATLLARIKNRLNVDLTDVDPNEWFKILSTNEYGWVTRVQIGPDGGPNTSCTGTWFRETLLAGQSVDGRSLRSHCFTVTYDADLDCFIFDVYGYGHGCGMSQWGAIGYANNGWEYDQILTHYYTGTTITTY